MRTTFTYLIVVFLVLTTHSLISQTLNPWQFVEETTFKKENQERRIIPEKYNTAWLEIDELEKLLVEAPQRFSSSSKEKDVIISLPFPDGNFQNFRIEKWAIMHPSLATKFPEIQTYVGYGIDDPTSNVRLDITPHGFHAMIRSGMHNTIFIDPYTYGDKNNYIIYFKKDFTKDTKDDIGCFYHEVNKNIEKVELLPFNNSEQGDCDLRTYRLALACTGEYTTYHGGTTTLALAAMTTTMNRVNGIFENDVAVHLQMVANNNLLVFTNSSTDPYTNNDGSAMLGENQTECDNIIGSSNYDIGHVFSTGGGGVAYLQSVCNNSIKAGGVTGQSTPVGDPFDVDYVCHELGHQFGANHTQNNNCNRNSSTSMEPGSGSTIMSYAGICSPNVQSNSDDYFHAISLQEIGNFITGGGNSCASVTVTGNNQPTANAGLNYTIPHSTPFVLTGTATDADGTGGLTYTWEQMDSEVGTMPPQSTNSVGPMFRSEKPNSSPSRYFPNLADIANNVTPTWEVLASVARSYDFRFSVRDNNSGAGCTAEDDMTITVDKNSGPFQVTSPNTAVSWTGLSNQTITWNVASSNIAPVSASNVDIFLSIDGGLTYPTTLASGVTNDGSHIVTIPNVTTTSARIMVKGANHVFFDISNQDFAITAPQSDFSLNVSPSTQTICTPTDAIYTIDVGTTGIFAENVDLMVSGVPAGATSTFSTNPVSAPGTSNLTIGNTLNVNSGTYTLTITATGSTGTKTSEVELIVSTGTPVSVSLSSPSNGAIGISNLPTLSWSSLSTAITYNFELATDAGFVNIIESQSDLKSVNYNVSTSLNPSTIYYWRVQAMNGCGVGSYSSVWSFTTASQTCNTFSSTDVPKTISTSGAPTVTSTLVINDSGTIDDLNLNNLNVSHTWVNDLVISITSPSGKSVTVVNQLCNSEDDMDLNFDDEATNLHSVIPCPPIGGGLYQPNQTLSAFDGEEINGTWTLTVEDLFNQDGGVLNSWELEICYSTINNDPLTVSTSGINISCNGGANGSTTVLPSGGAQPYKYTWSNGGDTEILSNLTAGIYAVTVTDNNGTTATSSITLSEPSTINLTTSSTIASCDQSNGSATISATGGTPPFSFIWSNSDTTSTISNLVAGIYSVTVIDANSCTSNTSVTVDGTNAITASVTSTDVNCNGGTGGTASASASDGSGNYSYLWSNGNFGSTLIGLIAGTYDVTITDDETGCAAITSAIVNEPSALIITTSFTQSFCGQNNGSASVFSSGGTPGYSYLWSNGSSSSTIDNLAPGTYSVTVTDSKNCSEIASVTVTGTNSISGSVTGSNVNCNGGSDGFATASGAGGTGNYGYFWSTGSSNQTITGLSAGSYTVTIVDLGTDCSDLDTIVINELSLLFVAVTSSNASCGENNGTATAIVSGGAPGYSYLWSTGASTETITNLSAGNYFVTVMDGNNCDEIRAVTVGNTSGISASIIANNVTCQGGNDGSASVNISGGSGNFSYNWNNGSTSASINNIPAGEYAVTVTDEDTGCAVSDLVTISEPDVLLISISSTSATCGNQNGSASVAPTGGTQPYSYLWSSGETTSVIDNLSPSTYFVSVFDGNGCSVSDSITISGTNEIKATAQGTDVSCDEGNDGTASALASNGSGFYSYSWSNGGNTQSISGLMAGTYSVTIQDNDSGCTATSSTTIIEPTALMVSTSTTNASCGENNGTAFVNISGGTPDYSYSWSNQSTNTSISNLQAGIYTVTVVDGNGCMDIQNATVNNTDGISISSSITNVSCNGGNDGAAEVIGAGGSGNYSYNWNNGETTSITINLKPGTYSATVTDDDSGCMASTSLIIEEPSLISINGTSTNATCGNENGSIITTVNGGTPGFSFGWSNGETTESIYDLSDGIYTLTITDDNGCQAIDSFEVIKINEVGVTALGTNVTCNGGNDGIITASGSGGSENYSYTWSNGESGNQINNLSADIYSVTILDNTYGCESTTSTTLTEPNGLKLETSSTNSSCGNHNGTAHITVSGGSPDYAFEWSNEETTQTISSLSPGLYTVIVTDANGCQAMDSVIVNNTSGIIASISGANVSCNGGNNGSAAASGSGGSGNYSYIWSNSDTTSTINDLSAGVYSVTIIDKESDCESSATVTIEEPSALSLFTSSELATCGNQNGSASIAVNGGTQPYTYSWSNGGTNAKIIDLLLGDYTVTITDGNGCTETAIEFVNGTNAIVVSASGIDVSCHGGNDGTATSSVSNGTSNYEYLWSNGESSQNIIGLSAGTYTVTIIDLDSECSSIASVSINEPDILSLSILGNDALNGNDGSADLTVNGGTPSYSYVWSNGETVEDISNLTPDSYSVIVTDSNGCSKTSSVNIDGEEGCNENEITFKLVLDDYPGETTWELTDDIGTIVDSGGPYNTPGQTITNTYCLPNGCYEFTILDSWGDGICCSYGAGSYILIDETTGNPSAAGGQFGASETRSFCLPFAPSPCTYETIDDEDFESGWGIWNDGGSDCRKSSNDKNYANSGVYCARLRDNTSTSVITTDNLDLTGYEEITVDFSYYVRSFENVEDFWLQISTNGGGSFTTVEEWNRGDEFENNQRKNDTVIIPGPFTGNTKLRFRADASGNSDWVYLDDILISGCSNLSNQNILINDDEVVIDDFYLIENELVHEEFDKEFASELNIFPNPTSSILNIEYRVNNSEEFQILITDFSGQVLQRLERSEGANSETLDLKEMNSGYYLLHLINGRERISKKFVIIK